METFSTLLAICAGNSQVPGEVPAQRPVTRSFDGFFYLCLNQWLSKQQHEAGDLRRYRAHYDVFVMNTRGHGIIIPGIDLDILEYFNLSCWTVQL